MTVEIEIRVTWPQVKECLHPLKAGDDEEGLWPCCHPDFEFRASPEHVRVNFCCFKPRF